LTDDGHSNASLVKSKDMAQECNTLEKSWMDYSPKFANFGTDKEPTPGTEISFLWTLSMLCPMKSNFLNTEGLFTRMGPQ
jgi:hypothetical protein